MRATGSILLCRCCRSHARLLRGLLLAKFRSESTDPGWLSYQTHLYGADAHSDQHVQIGEHLGGLHECSLCGKDEPADWFDLDSLLEEVQNPMEGLFSGHESDESGCSASSRISQQQPHARDAICMPDAQPDSLDAYCDGGSNWCFQSASTTSDSLAVTLPSQDVSGFSEEDLLMCLDVACQELGVLGDQPTAPSARTPVRSCDAALSTATCLPAEAQPAAPLLRATSSNSSAGTFPSAAYMNEAEKGLSAGVPILPMPKLTVSNSAPACSTGQRKRGRSRRYDTTLPLLPGAMEAQATAAMAGHINGVNSEKRKRTRGAKPKYHFLTAEEAIAHRRERNRITALASYEKRKANENALRNQIGQLEQEQAALKELLDLVQQRVVDKGMVKELLLRPDASVCTVVKLFRSIGVQ